MNSYAVVGAGPAGSISAKTLARSGDVTLIEEHDKQPVQCAGLLSVSGLARLGIKPGDSVLNKVSGARFISPEGRTVEIKASRDTAYVVDRQRFDEILQEDAVNSGAEYVNERATKASRGWVEAGGGRFRADRIVLASGVNYRLHRKLGLEQPKRFLVGAQYDVNVSCGQDFVELHFNVPGFFSWVIPAGDFARVGLCCGGNPMPYLNSFLKHLKDSGRVSGGKPKNLISGLVPVYEPDIRTDYGWLVTVGDAAGHVKATTGGGVILGGVAATHVPEKDYERAWRRDAGRELYMHLMIRRFLDRSCRRGVESVFNLLEAGAHALEAGGDMDEALKTVKSLAASPRFMASLMLNAPWLLASLL